MVKITYVSIFFCLYSFTDIFCIVTPRANLTATNRTSQSINQSKKRKETFFKSMLLLLTSHENKSSSDGVKMRSLAQFQNNLLIFQRSWTTNTIQGTVSHLHKYCYKYLSYVYNQHPITQYFLRKHTMARTVEDKSIMQPSLCRTGELAYINPCEVNNICGRRALYYLFPRKQSEWVSWLSDFQFSWLTEKVRDHNCSLWDC